LTGTEEETTGSKFRIPLLGFDDDDYVASLATFCNLFGSGLFERGNDLLNIPICGLPIFSIVVNARFVGLSVEDFMKPLREKFPGDHIVIYAYGKLPMGLIKRFYLTGADIVFSNIGSEREFVAMRDAVRRRNGYKSDAIRKAISMSKSDLDGRYELLTPRLRKYVDYTIQGDSVKEISCKLAVKEATVTSMRKKALKILGLRHASEMIREGTLYGYGLK